jgi:hypothetical protein
VIIGLLKLMILLVIYYGKKLLVETVLFNFRKETTDGGYILGGSSSSGISGEKTQNSRGNDDYWVVKLDENRNIIWDKTYGGTGVDRLTSIIQTTVVIS